MNVTRALWAQHRQPMIKFLGKRTLPIKIDHTPHVHPASPSSTLPESFAVYRQKASQHGPLMPGGQQPGQGPSGSAASQTSAPYGAIGGRRGRDLGSVEPQKGEFWDRNELEPRFRRKAWSQAEIDAIESGGASVFG